MHRELEICNVFWEIRRNKRERSVLVGFQSARHRLCVRLPLQHALHLIWWCYFIETTYLICVYGIDCIFINYIGSMVSVLVQQLVWKCGVHIDIGLYSTYCMFFSFISTWFSVFACSSLYCIQVNIHLLIMIIINCCYYSPPSLLFFSVYCPPPSSTVCIYLSVTYRMERQPSCWQHNTDTQR